jgi:hypothetical protein
MEPPVVIRARRFLITQDRRYVLPFNQLISLTREKRDSIDKYVQYLEQIMRSTESPYQEARDPGSDLVKHAVKLYDGAVAELAESRSICRMHAEFDKRHADFMNKSGWIDPDEYLKQLLANPQLLEPAADEKTPVV